MGYGKLGGTGDWSRLPVRVEDHPRFPDAKRDQEKREVVDALLV